MLPLLAAALISLASGDALDLGGATLRCESEQVGIHAFGDGITIRNGKIVGCHIAILVEHAEADYGSSAGIVVEGMTLIDSDFRGMRVVADGGVIRDNLIVRAGGCAAYANSFAMGIEAVGRGLVVEDNTVVGVTPVGSGEGLGVSISEGGVGTIVRRNAITGVRDYGIWIGGASRVLVENNVVTGSRVGFAMSSPTGGIRANNKFIECATDRKIGGAVKTIPHLLVNGQVP